MNVHMINAQIRSIPRMDAETAADLVNCIACEFKAKKFNIAPSVAAHIQESLDYAASLLAEEAADLSLEDLDAAMREKRQDEALAVSLGK
ncbi:hypothetical protein M8A51_25705 [Schlegelella sp. S2-27]|uniref:Uncharacterized protein n=1 Tax=Caldimonas mangrovi TaxID=2944811 RepID=A0ABT0YWF1_9BURK|nr:hypothetical protein [Caldimonas mangrovi]MCM5682933.1 hypothetical protein [Caldimonas mangrovi]